MRSTFSSPRLVRLLDGWSPLEADPAGPDFAERLSLWVNAFDAIGLQSAQQQIQALGTAGAGRSAEDASARLQAVEEDVRRVRTMLAAAIAQDLDDGAWMPRHLELQRQMEQAIVALRERTRQALARVSPRLRQLAALDAVFERLLAAHEQALLPTAASLVERRLKKLRAQPSDGGSQPDGDGAARERGEWRQALLAELDLRLAPVAGLVEALDNECRNRA